MRKGSETPREFRALTSHSDDSIDLSSVAQTLTTQFGECQELLWRIPNGEGARVRIGMSVDDLGKLDMYQWICFLAQHALRHVEQIRRILEGLPELRLLHAPL